MLEGRARNHAEEKEYRNRIRTLGGSLPAEDEVLLMEDSLRQTATGRRAARLHHWRELLIRLGKLLPGRCTVGSKEEGRGSANLNWGVIEPPQR